MADERLQWAFRVVPGDHVTLDGIRHEVTGSRVERYATGGLAVVLAFRTGFPYVCRPQLSSRSSRPSPGPPNHRPPRSTGTGRPYAVSSARRVVCSRRGPGDGRERPTRGTRNAGCRYGLVPAPTPGGPTRSEVSEPGPVLGAPHVKSVLLVARQHGGGARGRTEDPPALDLRVAVRQHLGHMLPLKVAAWCSPSRSRRPTSTWARRAGAGVPRSARPSVWSSGVRSRNSSAGSPTTESGPTFRCARRRHGCSGAAPGPPSTGMSWWTRRRIFIPCSGGFSGGGGSRSGRPLRHGRSSSADLRLPRVTGVLGHPADRSFQPTAHQLPQHRGDPPVVGSRTGGGGRPRTVGGRYGFARRIPLAPPRAPPRSPAIPP